MPEDEIQPDDMENTEVLQDKVENAEMSSAEEGFLEGYNEDIEPDTSDEEGLEDDEKLED